MDLLLIRHGEPDTEEGRTTSDPGLSEKGHTQAAAMADFVKDEQLDAIYVSSMKRARETSAPLEAATGLAAIVSDEIREFDSDDDEYLGGRPLSEVPESIKDRFRSGLDDSIGHAFRDKVTAEIERIIAENRGKNVAVVCHGGVISAYLSHLANGTRPMFTNVGHSSITRVSAASNGYRSVNTVSEMPHLPRRNPQPGQGFGN